MFVKKTKRIKISVKDFLTKFAYVRIADKMQQKRSILKT